MKQLEDFISLAHREFKRLKELADDATSQISAEQFFIQPSPSDNSLALIYKHMSGNMLSRWTDFLTTDGEKPNRNRDSEFTIVETDSFESLNDRWNSAWSVLLDTISNLNTEDLSRVVKIRGEGLTVLQAISRQLTHYGYHVGQIVFLAKHLAGDDWKSLSIPLGESAKFNKSPSKYVEEK